jgi:hypothetical protein
VPASTDRQFWTVYEHLRIWHGIPAAVLSRARTMAHLEQIHDDYRDEGCTDAHTS